LIHNDVIKANTVPILGFRSMII